VECREDVADYAGSQATVQFNLALLHESQNKANFGGNGVDSLDSSRYFGLK
jgi:hypothetical protein